MESIYIKDEPDDLDDSYDSSDSSSNEENSTNIDVKHEPFEDPLVPGGFLKQEIDASSDEFGDCHTNGNDGTTSFNKASSNVIALIIPRSTNSTASPLASNVCTQSRSIPPQKQPVLGLPSILRKPAKNEEALTGFLKQLEQQEQQQQQQQQEEKGARNECPTASKVPKLMREGERYCCAFCTFSSVFEHLFVKHLKYQHRFLTRAEYYKALETQREKNRKQNWNSSEESSKDPDTESTNESEGSPDPSRNSVNSLGDQTALKNNNLFHASCESGKSLSFYEERKLFQWMESCQERGQLLNKASVSASAKFIIYTTSKKAKRKRDEPELCEHICVSCSWLEKFYAKPKCDDFNWSPSETMYDLSEDVGDIKVFSGEPKSDGILQERPGRRKAKRQATLPDPSATALGCISAGKPRGSSEAIIANWFMELKKFMLNQGFDSDKFLRPANGARVFMADIIGLFMAKKSRSTSSSVFKPIFCKKKCAHVMPEPYASGKEISVMCCMNALGAFPQPFLVFSRDAARSQQDLRGLKMNSFRRAFSPDGSFREEIFLTWLHFFDSWLKECKISKPVLLILDGTFTRVDFRASTFASTQKIMLYFTPPNSYNYLNPLCVGVFPKLISEFKKGLAAWEDEGNKPDPEPLSNQFPNLFMDAWAKVASPGAAVLGFSQSALVAYDYNSLRRLGEEFE